MSNLLKETEDFLKDNKYSFDDIEGIQIGKYRISVEHFRKLAGRTEYDSGYGLQMIDCSLVIFLKDKTWMTREEYDGAEWWRLHKRPTLHKAINDDKVKTLKERW